MFLALVLLSCKREDDASQAEEKSPALADGQAKATATSEQILRRDKLNSLIIPRVEFENTSLDEAVEFLTQISGFTDPETEQSRVGISFVIEKGSVTTGATGVDEELGGGGLLLGDDPSGPKIEHYHATHIPFGRAISQALALCNFDVFLGERYLIILPKGKKPAEEKNAILVWDEALEEAYLDEDSRWKAHAGEEIRRRLNSIILPKVDFENTPLDEALELLTQKAIEHSPDPEPTRQGIGFVIGKVLVTKDLQNPDEDLGGGGLLLGRDPNGKVIKRYQATDVSVGQAISDVCALVDLNVYITTRVVLMPKEQKPAASEDAILYKPEQ